MNCLKPMDPKPIEGYKIIIIKMHIYSKVPCSEKGRQLSHILFEFIMIELIMLQITNKGRYGVLWPGSPTRI